MSKTDPLPMTPVESSMLSGYHHDPDTRQLTVEFKNGKRWRYDDVGVDKVVTMAGAQSPGRFFNDRIKNVHAARPVN